MLGFCATRASSRRLLPTCTLPSAPHRCSGNKRSAAAEPQQEQQEARPSKRARKAPAGPFHLATDARGAAEQARLEGIRRQQEEQARTEAEFKVHLVVWGAWSGRCRRRLVGREAVEGRWRRLSMLLASHLSQLSLSLLPQQALPLNKAALAGAWKPAPQAVAALTVPHEPHLRSDVRAARRAEFDATMATKTAQQEAERAALQAQQEAEEAEQEHRRRLGHKAPPLPDRL